MPFLTVAMLLSLLIGFCLPLPLTLSGTCYIPALVAVTTLVYLGRSVTKLSLFCFGSALGIVSVCTYNQQFYRNDFITTANHQYQVTGVISNNQFPVLCQSEPVCFRSLELQLVNVDGTPVSSSLYASIVTVRTEELDTPLQKGDLVSAKVKLNRPLGYENQFGFNYALWAFANGVYARGKTVSSITVVDAEPSYSQLILNKMHSKVSSLNNNAYFYPLLFAENSQLQPEQKQQLQSHGLSHLFAISGLHIGILYLLAANLLKLICCCWCFADKSHLIKLSSLALVWFYVWLIAMPLPATRAAILLSIWLLLSYKNQNLTRLNIFCIMVIASLVLQPTGVVDVSWWLSIWAVAGIFTFNAWLNQSIKQQQFLLLSNVKHAVLFQWFIGVWLLPVSTFWFAGASLSGFWLNLLLIPFFCLLVIPCLFLATALLLLGAEFLSSQLFQFVDQLFDINQLLLSTFSIGLDWWPIPQGLISFLLLLLVIMFFKKWFSNTQYLSLLSGFVALVFGSVLHWQDDDLKLYVLDVGQGTSVLLQRHGQALIYDLGPVFISGFSATKAVVAPSLVGMGINQLDRVIISHPDSDHLGDINAINHWLDGLQQTHCPENTILWQQSKIERFWPKADAAITFISDNDTSCVLKITDQLSGRSLLLTGDITKKVELELVKMHHNGEINLQADVLFSPHHGSKHSSSYPFLKATKAQYMIHTAGVFNHFGFPTAEVQTRADNLNIKQFSTSSDGQLSVNFDSISAVIEVTTRLNRFSPFWKKQNPFSFQREIR